MFKIIKFYIYVQFLCINFTSINLKILEKIHIHIHIFPPHIWKEVPTAISNINTVIGVSNMNSATVFKNYIFQLLEIRQIKELMIKETVLHSEETSLSYNT